MVENEYTHPYFEDRSETRGFLVHPFATVQLQLTESEVVSDEQDGDRFTKEVRVVTEWPVRLGVEEFVDVYRDWIREVRSDDDLSSDLVENSLNESWVKAFVQGDTGSNLLEYEEIVDQSIQDVKETVAGLEEPVDWGQLYFYEVCGRDRKSVKGWIEYERRQAYSIRYESVSFSYLRVQGFYPGQIGHLAFNGFIGDSGISWWGGIGTNMQFLPNIEERMPEESDAIKAFQDELDEEFSHLTMVDEFQQEFEYSDGEYTPVRELGDDEDVELERLRFFLGETVLDSVVERAMDSFGVDSEVEAVEAALSEIEEEVRVAIEGFEAGERDVNVLETAVERRREE